MQPSQHFYCRALAGESTYNISINSDLTVSCSCQDAHNEGYIGDLKVNTLKEIFYGEKANNFRSQLAQGVYPTSVCQNCFELYSVPGYIAHYKAQNYKLPDAIMVENCAACNFRCKHCSGREALQYRKTAISSIEEIRRVSSELNACNVQNVISIQK